MKHIGSVILGLSLLTGAAYAQDELFKPSHGGHVVKKFGLGFEVVRKPKEFLVYAPDKLDDKNIPGILIMKYKNRKGAIDQIEMKLLPPKKPGDNIYSAQIPTKVYIAGGLTFDLDLNKKETVPEKK